MSRLLHLAMSAAVLLLVLAAASVPNPGATGAGSWGSSLTMHDPAPGFWRAQPSAVAESAQTYAAGMSSLVATTRIAVAPGDDPELTNLGSAGAILLESGALVLTNAEGLVALQRGGEIAGLDPAPIGVGAMLMRGDRIIFHSLTTVAFRNAEATAASLLLTTEISEFPLSTGGIVQ